MSRPVGSAGHLFKHDRPPRLTPRECECLTWSALGKTSEDTGAILGICEGVVRSHLQSAQHKLGCCNRTHTVAKAMALRLIEPELVATCRPDPST